MVIHKYELEITDFQRLAIIGAVRVLSVAVQRNELVIYVVKNKKNLTKHFIEVKIVGTGNEHTIEVDWDFRGSHLVNNGTYVWHVWTRIV